MITTWCLAKEAVGHTFIIGTKPKLMEVHKCLDGKETECSFDKENTYSINYQLADLRLATKEETKAFLKKINSFSI